MVIFADALSASMTLLSANLLTDAFMVDLKILKQHIKRNLFPRNFSDFLTKKQIF